MDAETYFLTIERHGREYRGRLRRDDSKNEVDLGEVELGPQATVDIDGKVHRLQELVDELTAFNVKFLQESFDERGQVVLGSHLYRQTFGRLPNHWPVPAIEADVRFRVVVNDDAEDIVRLPWALLARDGTFLCANGWSVGLCHRPDAKDYELPPSPRILAVVPEPAGEEGTGAEEHLEQLEELLGSADPLLVRGEHFHVARTWEQFRDLSREIRPSVLYYYGHGEGDPASSHLLFEGPNKELKPVPLADVAHHLRHIGGAPLLAYINCCHGNAGGVLGAGWQLGTFIPAVLTNRTTAFQNVAQQQALEFFNATLLRGIAPHDAAAGLYSRLGDMGLSFRDVRWMTPVFHGSYNAWHANPPQPVDQSQVEPHWESRIDRDEQFSYLAFKTRKMMERRRPRWRAYIWYGQPGFGVDSFHNRVRYDLCGELEETHLHRVEPLWPDELQDPHRSFKDMVCHAFDVTSLEALPGRIRTLKRGETGRHILIIVRHSTFRRGGATVKPSELRAYLEWWHYNVGPRLRDAGSFALLGLSFVVPEPAKFCRVVQKTINESEVRRDVRILDELVKITRNDLEEFLANAEIRLPARIRDRELERILNATGGRYDETVEALRELQNRAWHVPSAAAEEDLVEGDSFGF